MNQRFKLKTRQDKTCPVQRQRKAAALRALAWSVQRSLCKQRVTGNLTLNINRRKDKPCTMRATSRISPLPSAINNGTSVDQR